jgi:hypothetical protein
LSQLVAEMRTSKRWDSVTLKALKIARSLPKYAGLRMYGQINCPCWPNDEAVGGAGAAKQLGLNF